MSTDRSESRSHDDPYGEHRRAAADPGCDGQQDDHDDHAMTRRASGVAGEGRADDGPAGVACRGRAEFACSEAGSWTDASHASKMLRRQLDAPRAGIPRCPRPATASRHPRRSSLARFVLGLTALNYAGGSPPRIRRTTSRTSGPPRSRRRAVRSDARSLPPDREGAPEEGCCSAAPPRSWSALGLAAAALVAIYLAAFAYTRPPFALGDCDPTEEQGLVPDGGTRAGLLRSSPSSSWSRSWHPSSRS